MGIPVKLVPGMSFIEQLYATLKIDPEEGLIILNASRIVEMPEKYEFNPKLGCLIGQVGLPIGAKPTSRKFNLGPLANLLEKKYPHNHPAIIARCVGFPSYEMETREITVKQIASQTDFINNLTSLYIPPID